MQGSRTGIALALVAALGIGSLAGCSSSGGGEGGSASDGADSNVIDSFANGAPAWAPVTTGGATIGVTSDTLATAGASSSTAVTYQVDAGGSAGLERNFSPVQDWSAASALSLWVYGRATGHTFLVQVYDAGYERWEARFPVDFSGWRQINIPLASLTRAAWQPPTARADGVCDLAGVAGMALVPSDGPGNGEVNVDELTLVQGASSASGSSSSTGSSSSNTGTPSSTSGASGSAPTKTPTTSPTATGGPAATSSMSSMTAPTAAPQPSSDATPTATPQTAPTTPTSAPTGAPADPTGTSSTAPAATPTSAPAATPAASAGPTTGTIIPLYTPPTDPSWAAVAAAKAAHPAVPVLAVVNPANGPGGAASADYAAGIARLTAAGVKVIGYVHTLWGARAASELQTEMGQWKSWYPGVSGVFFDEMANAAGHESYYSSLTSYAKGAGFDFTIGNPGSDSTPSYVGTEDVILIYENGGVPGAAALGGWHAGYARTNFGVIPYGVASLDTSFIQSAKAYVGYIYLQSDTLPNPWDSVPSYLADLVAALD